MTAQTLERRACFGCGGGFGHPEDRTILPAGDLCRPCADALDVAEGRPPCPF